MRTMLRRFFYGLSLLVWVLPIIPAFAAEAPKEGSVASFFPVDPAANKYIGAALAIGMSTVAAGLAIGRAGSAGLAAAAERPEIRTTAIIISALGEALGIYGLVVALLILTAAG